MATVWKATAMRWSWAYALVAWAETHLARGKTIDFELAEEIYREALALFEEMETEFYVNMVNERLILLRN